MKKEVIDQNDIINQLKEDVLDNFGENLLEFQMEVAQIRKKERSAINNI